MRKHDTEKGATEFIEVNEITKKFVSSRGSNVLALNQVSFSVKKGEFFSILGPSGCGKTTLLNIISGLEEATSGEVLFDGIRITSPIKEISVVFQTHALFPWKTVSENIQFGLKVRGIERQERKSIAVEYIKMIGLEKFENSYPHELSEGMKQRVALARALVLMPRVLLMDEPFGALDAQSRLLFQEELLKIWSKHKITVIFVTHSIEEASYLSDKMAIMTARPGSIKTIVEDRLARPRWRRGDRESIRFSKEFSRLNERVWSMMRSEVIKTLKEEWE